MSKPHRSFTTKSRLEMVQLNLKQQLSILDRFYPNYELSRLLLEKTIASFGQVMKMPGGTVTA